MIELVTIATQVVCMAGFYMLGRTTAHRQWNMFMLKGWLSLQQRITTTGRLSITDIDDAFGSDATPDNTRMLRRAIKMQHWWKARKDARRIEREWAEQHDASARG